MSSDSQKKLALTGIELVMKWLDTEHPPHFTGSRQETQLLLFMLRNAHRDGETNICKIFCANLRFSEAPSRINFTRWMKITTLLHSLVADW